MKVSKLETSSFAISQDVARNMIDYARKKSKGGSSFKLEGHYAPLGRFVASRLKDKASGGIKFLGLKKTLRSKQENNLYVNLNNGKLLYIAGKTRHTVEIEDIDYFDRLSSISPLALSALGYLIENGSVKREEFDENTIRELVTAGLAEEYVYERNILVHYFVNEIATWNSEDPIEGTRLYVRPVYTTPHFKDKRYNLGNFLEFDDKVEASFLKDPIKFSEEQVRKNISMLIRGKADLAEIVYLPYYLYSEAGKGRQTQVLASLKGKHTLELKNPLKLAPISLYSMDVGSNLVPVESDVITFKDIANLDDAKDEIRRKIIQPLQKSAHSGAFTQEVGGGILFYGPPGCGKTYLAKAAVGEIGVAFIAGNIEDIMGEGVDMAPKKLHELFEYARSVAPCVLFFDEIDAIASRRETHIQSTLVNQLLTEMDGIFGGKSNILIIGATNMPWRIDPALLRSGRFTDQIYVHPPDFDSRIAMFDIYLKKRSDLSAGVTSRELASLTEYYSASDVKTIVDRAAVFALESSMTGKTSKHKIQQWHLIQAIRERRPSLVPWFKFAEKQMEVEGAREAYPELWKDIKEFNSTFLADGMRKQEEGLDLQSMLSDKKRR